MNKDAVVFPPTPTILFLLGGFILLTLVWMGMIPALNPTLGKYTILGIAGVHVVEMAYTFWFTGKHGLTKAWVPLVGVFGFFAIKEMQKVAQATS